jgi:multidrug efflux pump subunit AcrB
MLVCLFGVFSGRRMPTDIFPGISILVLGVVGFYDGMAAREIQT